MTDNQNQIYFNKGQKYQVELSFNECKSGKRDNGQSWYRYAVKYDGSDAYFFANDFNLHNKLKMYTKGDVLTIEPKFKNDEKYPYDWDVVSISTNKPLDEIMKKDNTEVKISTWAAMKVASSFSKDIDALDINTQLVLELHKKLCKEEEESLF